MCIDSSTAPAPQALGRPRLPEDQKKPKKEQPTKTHRRVYWRNPPKFKLVNPFAPRDLVTIREAAAVLGRPKMTIYSWLRLGLLNRYGVSARKTCISWRELEELHKDPPLLGRHPKWVPDGKTRSVEERIKELEATVERLLALQEK